MSGFIYPSTVLGLTNVGSNYAWFGNTASLLSVSASAARSGFEVIPNYLSNKALIDAQLVQMREAGQTAISLPIWWTAAPGDVWPDVADASTGNLPASTIENLRALTSEIKSLGFDFIEYRSFPWSSANPQNWTTWNQTSYQTSQAVLSTIHEIASQTEVPYTIDLGNEGVPVKGLPSEATQLLYDQRIWSWYSSVYGTTNTVGFSVIPSKVFIDSIPDVYGSNFPTTFDFHIYGKMENSDPNRLSAGAVFDSVHQQLAELGLSGRKWIIGETIYNDPVDAAQFAARSQADNQPVSAIFQWPVDTANIRSADGDGGTDVAPPLLATAYLAVRPLTPPLLFAGTGPDVIKLELSEDAWQGDAKLRVSVDGIDSGKTFTVTATHREGAEQMLDLYGTFSSGSHTITTTFTNDAYGGSALTDRNLYLDGAYLNGTKLASSTYTQYASGTKGFALGAPFNLGVIGEGPNTLLLGVSEDRWLADAQFTVTVDGTAIGSIETASAIHSCGQSQSLVVKGTFAAGPHLIGLAFLNDLYGGSSDTDRNLYLDSVKLDGLDEPGSQLTFYSAGEQSILLGGALQSSGDVGSGPDCITLFVSEDAWTGDARFTISVDGYQEGAIQSVTSLHSLGQDRMINVFGTFSTGSHSVGLNFLNDAYGGSSDQDRNLYLDAESFEGIHYSQMRTLLSNGEQDVTIGETTIRSTSLGAGLDCITMKLSSNGEALGKLAIQLDGVTSGPNQDIDGDGNAGRQDEISLFADSPHDIKLVNNGTVAITLNDVLIREVSILPSTYRIPAGQSEHIIISGPPVQINSPDASKTRIDLSMSEDAWKGNAQFTIMVDGSQVGGEQTVFACKVLNIDQTFSLWTDLVPGSHSISIDFLNDKYGGSPKTDRNLYVDNLQVGGSSVGNPIELASCGIQQISFLRN